MKWCRGLAGKLTPQRLVIFTAAAISLEQPVPSRCAAPLAELATAGSLDLRPGR